MTLQRWWSLADVVEAGARNQIADEQEALTALEARLGDAVRLQSLADVPLGAFLSGGVDSSIIVALMSRLSSRRVKTFSIGFDHAAFSELHYARQVADSLGTDHTEFVVKPEMADALPLLARHFGEPFADASALPTYYVARETRKHVTVALNGDGGDENFSGYLRYQAAKAASVLDRLPRWAVQALWETAGVFPEGLGSKGVGWKLRRFLDGALERDPAARHLAFARFFTEGEKRDLYNPTFAARAPVGGAIGYFQKVMGRAVGLDGVNRSLYTDFSTYLPEDLMTKVDIAAMAVSLEGRSPFLDHEFASFVFRLPGRWKLKGFTNLKWILRETFKDLLPPAIRCRGKMGFGIPLGPWFRHGQLRDLFQETVLSQDAFGRDYFQEGAVRGLFDDHVSGRRDNGYKLWALLMLEMWHRHG
jgi:asparagine synthase (glutamine-hydrolysing)